MNNLKIQNYQHAPTATTTQKGGRGYRHKKSCKCRSCKKRGGMDPDTKKDIDELVLAEEGYYGRSMPDANIDALELGPNLDVNENVNDGLNEDVNEDENEDIELIEIPSNDNDDSYTIDIDELEEGKGPSGGTRRRKYRNKSKKVRKSKKTRHHSRKVKKHGRKSHRRHRK